VIVATVALPFVFAGKILLINELQGCADDPNPRQTVARRVCAFSGSLSVVCSGKVNRSTTAFPRRTAAKSFTTPGNSSEGARGGPGLAQPTSSATSPTNPAPMPNTLITP